jgi:hypothetical protein
VRACYEVNCSAWSTGAAFNLAAVQENNKSVGFGGTWTSQAVAGSYGGSVRYASTNRDKTQYKFTGSSVALVSTTGPNRGRATIIIDGVTVATVDLYSATQQTGKVIYVASGLSAGASHQVVVQVQGARNPLSTANRVDLDAFITLP